MSRILSALFATLLAVPAVAADPPALSVLFLGDAGHHQPAARFRQLQPVFAARNIALTYTDKPDDLTAANLAKYDGLMVYANIDRSKPEHVKAILDFVAAGKGFVPLHCASYCFIDNPDYVALVGAQFRSHTTGVFRVQNAQPDHLVMKGFSSFESWDETYTHTKHNTKDRTVLEYRVEGDVKEPWTWVRTHEKGRVFYTAWGHDQRTWSHPGFHNLVERGTRWACGQDPALAGPYVDAPKMTAITGPKSDFEYVPAKVPFYPPSRTWGAQAEPITTMQKPLTPEKSVKHYSVPEGFELKLFASDEQFGGKPICMTWDERGRLWVAVTVDYPNEMQREGEGRDKILILEDTDGDGKADKVTVFADKLSIPTSILHAHGGLIVTQAPHTLFLKDTDGDGKADVRQVLFTGWGTQDTHAGPSNLRYGFDNWIYGSVGYSGFNGTVADEQLRFRQGYYRFKLDRDGDGVKVLKLEFLRSTNNNTWGLAFDESGQLFGSTANGCVLVHMPIPNRYYEKVRGLSPGVLQPIALDNRFHPVTEKVRQVDWHGGFTAASNCAIYTARTYPPEYWNKVAFVSDPTGHLTATFGLQPAGTSYVARYAWNLAAADDEWASPIDAQVGPDGNVWLIDWYAYIVQHNPTPAGFRTGKGAAYETPLRDKTHGRIYRLVYTKAAAEPKVDLANATSEKLVETLKNSNMLWRLHAQRLLVERGKPDVNRVLVKLLEDRADERTGDKPGALHALWTVHGLGGFGGSSVLAGFRRGFEQELNATLTQYDQPAPVRRAIVTVLAQWPTTFFDSRLQYAAFEDPDPGVRVAALLALADRGRRASGSEYGEAIAKAALSARNYTDPRALDTVTVAATQHADSFLIALRKYPDGLFLGADAPAVKSTPLPRELAPVIMRVVRTMAAGSRTTDAEVSSVFAGLEAADPRVIEVVVTGLADGWPDNRTVKLDAEATASFGKVLTALPATTRPKLLKLGAAWGLKGLDAQLAEITKSLFVTVADAKASDAARLDAAKQIVEFRPADEEAAASLLNAINAQTSPQLAAGIFEALGQSKAANLGPAVLAKLGSLPPSARPAALRLVLARPEPTKAFLDAVEAGKLRFDLLALDQKTALAAHPDKAIADRAKKLLALGGGLPDPDRQKVIDQFHPILAKTGDVANGKKLFVQHCAKCHKHGGEGQTIGPDLTGFAVHPKEEILIAVLDPSRSVEGNYRAYTAKTLDGKVITGLLASESRTAVELLDAENKRHVIERDNIDELAESKKSLMPEGFEKQVTVAEFTDLMEFLTQKGKYLPLPLDKVATVVSTKGMFFDPEGTVERLVFPDWKPKTFKGVPFVLTDPQGDKTKNVILLYGPNGTVAPTMPKAVSVPCNTKAAAIHLLSGIGGWNFPATTRGTVSMIVRLHYADGQTEDHELRNGVHFADYIRRVDVTGSEFAFDLRGRQVRYLSVKPKRTEVVARIEFVKGPDASAPVVMAVTVETP